MSRSPIRSHLLVDVDGAVFFEVLVVIVPMWTLFLCSAQLALIAQASLVVRHAADSAVRSAIVVLPDDPSEYSGEPEGSISRSTSDSANVIAALRGLSEQAIVAGFGDERGSAFAQSMTALVSSRLNVIRLAAQVPLTPLSPRKPGYDPNPSLEDALGGRASLSSSPVYQPSAVSVTFPGVSGESVLGPEVTVRVSYAFQCDVPLARILLCTASTSSVSDRTSSGEFVPWVRRFVGTRFKTIEHDATLLVQDAPYAYRTRSR